MSRSRDSRSSWSKDISKKMQKDARYVKRGVRKEFKSIGKGVVSGLLDLLFFRR
jgi:hypothetical protein